MTMGTGGGGVVACIALLTAAWIAVGLTLPSMAAATTACMARTRAILSSAALIQVEKKGKRFFRF